MGGKVRESTDNGTGYKMPARLWRVPSPLAGDASRLTLWVQAPTARELDAGGGVHELDAKSWSDRRQRLDRLGGPPLP